MQIGDLLPPTFEYLLERVRNAYDGVPFRGFIDDDTLATVSPEDVLQEAANECWERFVEKRNGRFTLNVSIGDEPVSIVYRDSQDPEQIRSHLKDFMKRIATDRTIPEPLKGPATISVYSLEIPEGKADRKYETVHV